MPHIYAWMSHGASCFNFFMVFFNACLLLQNHTLMTSRSQFNFSANSVISAPEIRPNTINNHKNEKIVTVFFIFLFCGCVWEGGEERMSQKQNNHKMWIIIWDCSFIIGKRLKLEKKMLHVFGGYGGGGTNPTSPTSPL